MRICHSIISGIFFVKISFISLLLLVGAGIFYIYNRLNSSKDSMQHILTQAQKTNSDALIISKDNKIIAQYYSSGKPEKIQAMSITKSIVSLGIGILITQGKMSSINEAIVNYFPDLQSPNAQITIEQLLNHTSGIYDAQDATVEIGQSKDVVTLALESKLVSDPGSQFSYNNKAVNVLSAIIQKVSGKPMDIFIKEHLFTPLGISDFSFDHDPAGNPYANAGLSLFPDDLVKIGQLILNNGTWEGKRIISPEWIKLSFTPSKQNKYYGLLWWLLKNPHDEVIGYKADGYMGQYLIIYPEKKIVGVRMIKYGSFKQETDWYRDFAVDLYKI